MNVDEALKLLDQVCSQYQGTRQDHVAIQQAMEVVKKEVKEEVKVDKAEKTDQFISVSRWVRWLYTSGSPNFEVSHG